LVFGYWALALVLHTAFFCDIVTSNDIARCLLHLLLKVPFFVLLVAIVD